jgi:hypothetical protein
VIYVMILNEKSNFSLATLLASRSMKSWPHTPSGMMHLKEASRGATIIEKPVLIRPLPERELCSVHYLIVKFQHDGFNKELVWSHCATAVKAANSPVEHLARSVCNAEIQYTRL